MSFLSPDDVRPEVADFEPYEPGLAVEDIRLRYGLTRVIKLASNENPLGVSPKVLARLAEKANLAFRYPQAGNPRLVKALAERLRVDPARVFAGNGLDEAIDLLFRVRAVPGVHNVVASLPCFGLYVTQARLAGVEMRRVPLLEDFRPDLDGLLARTDDRTSLVFVTSPDNPSGRLTPPADILALARALPPGCLLVLDEAYIEFAGEENSLLSRLDEIPNLAVLRTFSKIYGLAGLRIGYAVLPPRLAEYMWRVRLPFSVNVLAEEAALAALDDAEYRESSLRLVAEGRALLTEKFRSLGFAVIPSHANFLMVSPPPGGPDAQTLLRSLLERGVIVRSLAAYRLRDWLRVTVGTEEENLLLLSECAAILSRGENPA
jgi:histidinol-phosphate aminotransferase